MDSFSEGMRKRLDNSSFLFRLIYKEEYKRLKKYETVVFDDFNRHSIISVQDKNTFSEEIKDKLNVVPNGVDITYFQSPGKKKKYDISFVGNMGYRPNIIACEYFKQKILPLLKKEKNDVKIIFAGARPHARVKALADNNIFISGWMEDIRDAYDESKIFVAPIFTGIGQQNKILEAMSMELPVITTSAVNKAIGAEPGKEVIVADTGQEFADAILRLLDNNELARQLGKASRKFVKNNYSWEYQYGKLKNLFPKNF
jgi:glycosyltransferase involved in cell wall biosynthesis